jgi:pimeloyl-ACP methyl ester carboxylesterase
MPTPRPEVFAFDGAGLRLVAERWPADNSRGIVVLLHGGGQTRHSWQRTAERLSASGWSAIAVDARGHGDSDWDPAQDYTLDAFVADLLALVATLEVPPVLVGASLGGMTALVAAGERPGLARGLVLVDVVVLVEPNGAARIIEFLTAHRNGFATLDEVAYAIAEYNPTRRRPRNLEGLRKNVRQRPDGRWYWHWDPAFIQIDDEPRRRADPERLRAAADGLEIPTLLVRGAESDVVSEAGIAEMRRLVPTAASVVIPGAGHMVAGDDNEVFVRDLEAFLRRLE